MNFEETIIKIDNEISIQKFDREMYAKDFDVIKNYLMDIMQKTDPVFKKIYAGPSLFGSYLENIKIVAPDEFDVHFLLKVPFYEHIQVQPDPVRPGYVKLLISKPLQLMKNDPNLSLVHNKFNKFVNSSNFLKRNKIQSWLKEIIKSALKTYGHSLPNAAGTDEYKLTYSHRGIAHTILAYSRTRQISIDFVPALRFYADHDWLAERPFPKEVKEKLWFAVPKPSVGPKGSRKYTFSICVPQIEKHMLKSKYNLKPTLRLLKSMRDKINQGYVLKSYFIKTIFLHENDKQSEDFWMQPTGKLLLHMLDRLLFYLNNKSIQFYWCPSMNLLESLSRSEISNLEENFQDVRNRLVDFSQQPKVEYTKLKRLFGKMKYH